MNPQTPDHEFLACTPAMLKALADAARPEGALPGSTVSAVKMCGFVNARVSKTADGKRSTRYHLTDSGRAALENGR